MIETTQLNELPEYWQGQIRKFRQENRTLRIRLRRTEDLLKAAGIALPAPHGGTDVPARSR
jgi:hypothetical protein